MATFEVEYGNERILPNSGIALVGAILEQGGFRETMNRLDVTGGRSGHQIKDGDLMSALWESQILRPSMKWIMTRSFTRFPWAWTDCLPK